MTHPSKLSFFSNFSWNFIGSIVYAFSQWIVLIIIAKFGTVEEVGIYSIGMALTAPIIMFTDLQLRSIQATDTDSIYFFRHYFALRILGNITATVILLIILSMDFYNVYKSFIILLVFLSKVLDSFSNVLYGQFQKNERMDFIGLSRTIKGIITIFVVFISYSFTRDLFISLVAMNISWFFIFLLFDLRNLRKFSLRMKPDFDWQKLMKLVKLALPLGVAILIISLNINIPRIFVERVLGDKAFGYFAAMLYFMVAGETLINAVGQAIAPRLARMYKKKKKAQFKIVILKSLCVAFSIGFIGISIAYLFGEYILTIVYGLGYSNYNKILVLIMIAATFNFGSAISGYAITAMRKFRIQPYLGVIWLIVSLSLSFLLIPTYGLVGAALTLIGSYGIQFVIQTFIVYQTKWG